MNRVGVGQVPSLPRRIVDVVFSPVALFAVLRERPLWVGTFLLGGLLVVLSAVLVPEELYVAQIREQLAESGAGGSMDAESFASTARILGSLGAVVFWTFWTFLVSGWAALVFAFVLGDEGRFVQYLSVTSHALLILAIGSLLLLPLKLATGDLRLTLSVGTFMDLVLEDGYVLRLFRGLDLLVLWAYLLVALGATRIDPRRSLASALVAMFAFAVLSAAAFAAIPGAT